VLKREWTVPMLTRPGARASQVIERKLIGRQHSLVDNRPARETGNVEHAALVMPRLASLADALRITQSFRSKAEIVRKLPGFGQ